MIYSSIENDYNSYLCEFDTIANIIGHISEDDFENYPRNLELKYYKNKNVIQIMSNWERLTIFNITKNDNDILDKFMKSNFENLTMQVVESKYSTQSEYYKFLF